MPTDIFNALTTDGYIHSISENYASARAGFNLTANTTSSTAFIGQFATEAGGEGGDVEYECIELFLSFDTSTIPDNAVITDVGFSIFGAGDQSTTDFNVEVRLHDWGPTLTTADWVAGADLGSKPSLAGAFFVTNPGWDPSYNVFSTPGTTGVNLTGETRVVVCSSLHRLNSAPLEDIDQRVIAITANGASPPRLTVTYDVPTGHTHQMIL